MSQFSFAAVMGADLDRRMTRRGGVHLGACVPRAQLGEGHHGGRNLAHERAGLGIGRLAGTARTEVSFRRLDLESRSDERGDGEVDSWPVDCAVSTTAGSSRCAG
jgi:hypothetical protein